MRRFNAGLDRALNAALVLVFAACPVLYLSGWGAGPLRWVMWWGMVLWVLVGFMATLRGAELFTRWLHRRKLERRLRALGPEPGLALMNPDTPNVYCGTPMEPYERTQERAAVKAALQQLDQKG